MTLTAGERIDALAERGVMLYADANGDLRARCEPCFAHILDAAGPMICLHRAELLAYLFELDAAVRSYERAR